MQYDLTTPAWSDADASAGGGLTANLDLDPNSIGSPVARMSASYLSDPPTIIRFDPSDRMPIRIGLEVEPEHLYAWISQDQDSDTTIANVEAAWPG